MDGYTINMIMYTIVIFITVLPFVVTIGVLLLPMCTGCDTPGARRTYAILQILLILFVFIAVSGIFLVRNGREFFIDNFEEYRCRPWFMPFVNWLRKDVDTAENMKKCASKKTSMLIGLMAVPLVNVTKAFGNGMNHNSKSVSAMTKNVAALADTVTEKITRTNVQMSKYQQIAMYLFLKCKSIFDKVGALVFNFYYAFISVTDLVNLVLMLPEIMLAILGFFVMITGIVMGSIMALGLIILGIGIALSVNFFTLPFAPVKYSLAALYFTAFVTSVTLFAIMLTIRSVLGSMYNAADRASYCCFAPSARVVLQGGAFRRMKDVRIGDVLLGGGTVRGVLEARSDARDWCVCGNTLVSAAHERWMPNEGRWARVGELYPRSRGATLHRICLVTDNHLIPTEDGWFRDFQEMPPGSEDIARDAAAALRKLNNTRDNDDTRVAVVRELERGEVQSGFEGSAEVATADGPCPIRDVRIGARMGDGGRVVGAYRVDLRGARGARSLGGTWIAYDQIVKDEGGGRHKRATWSKWYAGAGKSGSSPCDRIGYHLVTTTGQFHIVQKRSGGEAARPPLTVRDFLETERVA